MQSIFQEDSAPAEGTSRKTVARLVFGVLIVLSAAIGAATGVLFVNSTDTGNFDGETSRFDIRFYACSRG